MLWRLIKMFQLHPNYRSLTLQPHVKDRWSWALTGCGDFLVASIRKSLDNCFLPVAVSKTRWIHEVTIKVNILAWKVRMDGIPTRLNISKR
ncbi:hypothetical protein Tco_0288280, partial [Tanacetum coccineum]